MKSILIFFGVFSCYYVNAQDGVIAYKNRIEKFSNRELKRVLEREKEIIIKSIHAPLIKNDSMAIEIVEPVLFAIYGEKNIVFQKPYNIVKIDNYYVISGTLPRGYIGGTFVIIIDENNLRVLNVTHYK